MCWNPFFFAAAAAVFADTLAAAALRPVALLVPRWSPFHFSSVFSSFFIFGSSTLCECTNVCVGVRVGAKRAGRLCFIGLFLHDFVENASFSPRAGCVGTNTGALTQLTCCGGLSPCAEKTDISSSLGRRGKFHDPAV